MPQPQQSDLPPIPDEPVQEGSRWRFHRPTSQAVAEWFATVPLDEGMEHERFVGGVVLIPQSEKVKHQTQRGTVERYEQVFTPYMQIGTRVAYGRLLGEHRDLIIASEPADVPRATAAQSAYFNANMVKGLWWHVVQTEHNQTVRFLCCTWRWGLYERASYLRKLDGGADVPLISGEGTKQVGGGPDPNGIMKAQTGALGRALGVAGILVVGTGIASAEDMQEFVGAPTQAPALPPSEIAEGQPPEPAKTAEERLNQLRSQAAAYRTQLQERAPHEFEKFEAWWAERRDMEGWKGLGDVPLEALEGITERLRVTVEANQPTEVLS